MVALSLDYQAVLASLDRPLGAAVVSTVLLKALGDRYAAEHKASALHEFEQSGATYLFDLASSADLPQEDRTVAAWALTPIAVAQRDTSYQRGFPLAPHADEAPVDRGHVIPHLSGGEFGPNIFRQDRALNLYVERFRNRLADTAVGWCKRATSRNGASATIRRRSAAYRRHEH